MELKTKNIEYIHFTSLEEMDTPDQKLINEALSMLQNSYSPYSMFKVGSAVVLENGEIIKGSNQENMAYPSGLCAERVALFSAGASFPTVPIRKIAIAASDKNNIYQPVFPCGACLQVIAEYEQIANESVQIIVFQNTNSIYVFDGIQSMLPFTFHFIKEK